MLYIVTLDQFQSGKLPYKYQVSQKKFNDLGRARAHAWKAVRKHGPTTKMNWGERAGNLPQEYHQATITFIP